MSFREMPFGERDALTSLTTTLVVTALFVWLLQGQHAAGQFSGPDALQHWARDVLLLVCASIGIAIVVTIVFHVATASLSGATPDSRRDERDREIDRRALTFAWYVLSFGILGVIIDLALGASAFRAMNLILALCAVSEMFKDIIRLILYRGGL